MGIRSSDVHGNLCNIWELGRGEFRNLAGRVLQYACCYKYSLRKAASTGL